MDMKYELSFRIKSYGADTYYRFNCYTRKWTWDCTIQLDVDSYDESSEEIPETQVPDFMITAAQEFSKLYEHDLEIWNEIINEPYGLVDNTGGQNE